MITAFRLLCAFVLAKSFLVSSAELSFSKVSPLATIGFKFSSIAYGDGKFVAVGNGIIAVSSDDGVSWREAADYPRANFNVVTFANHRFAAAGDGIIYSDDGSGWSGQIIVNQGFRYIAYAGGTNFQASVSMLAGVAGNVVSRPQENSFPSTVPDCFPFAGCGADLGSVRDLRSTENAFICVVAYYTRPPVSVSYYEIFYSNEGLSWSLGGTASLDSEPVLVTRKRVVYESTHGANNTNALFAIGGYYIFIVDLPARSVALQENDSGTMISAGSSGGLWRNSNLQNPWQRDNLPDGALISSAALGPVIVGITDGSSSSSQFLVSTNGLSSLTTVTPPNGSFLLKRVRSGDGRFVAVGTLGSVLRSYDGVNWTRRLSNTSSDLLDVCYADGIWVAVGSQGKIVTSPDADYFNLRFSGTEGTLYGIAHGNGIFLAVGKDGVITSSRNGIDWDARGSGDATDLYSVAFGNGRFVATGTNGLVRVSSNGLNWTELTIPGVGDLSRIAFGNGFFVAKGSTSTNTLYYSTNGTQWSSMPLNGLNLLGVDYSDNELWLTGSQASFWKTSLSSKLPPKLLAGLDSAKNFVLTIDAAALGNYRIESAYDPTGIWFPVGLFSEVQGSGTWTNFNPQNQNAFFRVRRE